jgi:hypothetical protein
MKTTASGLLRLHADFLSAKRHQHIHKDDLMAPDLTSEIVLIGGALVIVLTILYVLWRTLEMS